MRRQINRLRTRIAEWIAPTGSKLIGPSTKLEGISGLNIDSGVYKVLITYQNEFAENLFSQQGGVVASGPFAGMPFVARSSWGDLSSKLIGCYEEELHSAIERGLKKDWDLVINIGCGEGYYSVGFARRLPQAKVLAHDISLDAQRLTMELACASGVQDRVVIGGEVDHAFLNEALETAKRPFLFVDCEGAELSLMDPDRVPALRGADILIECHDFVDRSITSELSKRFGATHDVELIRERSRDPRAIPTLSDMACFDASLVVCEFRPERMQWLSLSPRGGQAHSGPDIKPPNI